MKSFIDLLQWKSIHILMLALGFLILATCGDEKSSTGPNPSSGDPTAVSSNSLLSSLMVNPAILNPLFDKSVTNYDLTIRAPFMNVIAEVEDTEASVSIAYTGPGTFSIEGVGLASVSTLTSNDNISLAVTVAAESGDKTTYTVDIEVDILLDPTRLSSLDINPGTLVPDWSGFIIDYDLIAPLGTTNLTFAATAEHPRSSVLLSNTGDGVASPNGSDSLSLSGLTNGARAMVTATVIDENGEMMTYTIDIFVEQTLVTTFVGQALQNGFANGSGVQARFNMPIGLVADRSGNLYTSDIINYRIRKIAPDGMVSTFAGGLKGNADGIGSQARFNRPSGGAIDASGNIYVTDQGNPSIRKITPDGVVSTVAGTGTAGYVDGPAQLAQFNEPTEVAIDRSGNIYVAEPTGHRIRKISPDGMVSTVAGGSIGYVDGHVSLARFNYPTGVAVDSSGNIYVADRNNYCIRKISLDGMVSTVAGTGTKGYVDGPVQSSKFTSPKTVTVDDRTGDMYVTGSSFVRKISPDGMVSTVAGTDTAGYVDGLAREAQFRNTRGLMVDEEGTIYVVDQNNHCIRKIATGVLRD